MNSRPPDWDRLRKQVYRRDNYTCQNCGVKGGRRGKAELHAHHGVPLSKGGSNSLSNLTTYCHRCHRAIHSKKAVAPTANGLESPFNYELNEDQEAVITLISFIIVIPTFVFIFAFGSTIEGWLHRWLAICGVILVIGLLYSLKLGD
jgi:hypothetical protein